MPAFLVSSCEILDPDAYRLYAEAAKDLPSQFGGERLILGRIVDCLEGEERIGHRLIVTRFPDAVSARLFYDSDEYQAARRLRLGNADKVSMQIIEECRRR